VRTGKESLKSRSSATASALSKRRDVLVEERTGPRRCVSCAA
jgi:hypothetical protein